MATAGTSGTAPTRQTQRIQKDLQSLADNPLPFVRDLQLAVVNNGNELSGVLVGPDGSDYADGHFRFLVQFPPEYPFKPPEFFFRTPMCHPNVHSITGTTCHDQLLATWAPNITLSKLLSEMQALLAKPNYDALVVGDPMTDKSPEKAREWTQSLSKDSD